MFHVNTEDRQFSFAGCVILLVAFFQQRSFRIFAISVGFCMDSPVMERVRLEEAKVTLVLPGNSVFMSFHVFALTIFANKIWD